MIVTVRANADAIVIVPGIMGSTLVDTATGQVLWGLDNVNWYVKAWTTGRGLEALQLTDQERAGQYGRVKATGLLRFPAFARVLAGLEPYSGLVRAVRAAAVHPDAVLEFAYDWRLPVAHNATLLAEAADAHLRAWRAHPAHRAALAAVQGTEPARLVLVAHSMGGLLVRYLHTIPGATESLSKTLTLGTPFHGSVKAAVLLNTGRGAPLPARRPLAAFHRRDADEGLRALAAGLPGVHDLLPSYRCVDELASSRRLTVEDVVDLGGDRDLAEDANRLHQRIDTVALVGHRAMVGTSQPTWQSVKLEAGVITPLYFACEGPVQKQPVRVDRLGDGTVYRDSATADGAAHTYVAQQHGRLAATDDAIAHAVGVITERDVGQLGPPLGAGELGIELPDIVLPNQELSVVVEGVTNPGQVRCTVYDAGNGRRVDTPAIQVRDGEYQASFALPRPGLYRISVDGSGGAPVRQYVLAADPGL
ncbi:esterase/lipase family protein [Micromonospora coxensis]|uniref:Lecithin:cholesterol acyltransferase n=1 Tax=Micromonospora coxensis TaxID=356852 RepID=A0A1C5GY01_9ACTN|nr:hypothetical protein [Micromonospora coxensis]SCG38487.1 Lecithin:cholesterol acyltransferase [Micromonospora coxensis]